MIPEDESLPRWHVQFSIGRRGDGGLRDEAGTFAASMRLSELRSLSE